MDEKDLATQPEEEGQDPRLPGPDADPRRPAGPQAPPPEGALAAHAPGKAVKPGRLPPLRGEQAFRRLRQGRGSRGRYVSVKWLPAQELRVGLVVSKKVGKAVVRNRVRRRLREILRRLHLPEAHLLVVASPEARGATYQELFQDLVRTLKRSKLIQ